ncbi:FtsX-like permease family protein [Paenimyroides tangerinum]|uniref:Cell division protein FtsX n=1 Tax=Paenimyroides tangerinum TaxID=2488728 RepID=A0A3P3WK94_9FLAO|nr:permease-like cell division protein FtsX [Paenimyroides tangerinum]RRJ93313.1 FtsX-like permease family protein [Paenimyroides tangerinum]
MASSFERYQKRRLISSYFSVILSIFLVLFLLGSLGLFLINSEKISNNFRENIPMSLYFKDKATPDDLAKFEETLKTAPYIKDFKFVHKDSAAVEQQEVIGEDFVHFLGFNPLQNSYDIHFNGEYVIKDSIKEIELTFKENELIEDVVYDQQLVELVNENITKITFWVLVISAVFAFISFLLINSSLRLSVYSKRFIIKTMQMVGATKSFIRKPFIWTSVKLGMIGSILAIIGVLAIAYYADSKFPTLLILEDTQSLFIVCGGIFIVGIIITYISTFFATQRFLNLKSDDLY